MTELEFDNVRAANRFLLNTLRHNDIHFRVTARILLECGDKREAAVCEREAANCRKAIRMVTES